VEDAPVVATVMGRDEAAAAGAIGLFEEKYGDRVRVLATGDYSRELCGGTHVSHTGEIGPFVIVSESGTGSATRRIEALTGAEAVAWFRERERELLARLEARERRIRELEQELRRAKAARVDAAGIASAAVDVGGVRVLAREVDAADADELLTLSDRVRRSLGSGAAIVLGARADGRVHLVANFDEAAVARGLSAHEVVREVAPLIGGGGGGRPGMARAGGKDPSRLEEALAAAADIMRRAASADEG
jgi:alanyl-tRNA synthetase